MADKPYDRTIINERERPLSSDINQAQSQLDRAQRFMLERLLGARTSDASQLLAPVTGFIGDAFQVVPDSPIGLVVDIKAGLGFIYDPADVPVAIDTIVGLDDRQGYKPVLLLADATFAVPAAPGGADDRTDIVEVKVGRRTENPLSRDVLDLTSGQFVPTSVDKTLAFSHDGKTGTVNAPAASTAELSYKVGVAGTPGAVPATTAGYVKIAEIFVDTSVATIDADVIRDTRRLLYPGGVMPVRMSVRKEWNAGSPIGTLFEKVAPPGVEMSVHLDTVARGQIEFFVKAGELVKASAGLTIDGFTTNILSARFSGDGAVTAALSDIVRPATATDQTRMAGGTPSVDVALGQPILRRIALVKSQTGATTSDTDAALEDLTFELSALLSW